MDFLEELFSYCEENFPNEACGLIVEKEGQTLWFPCENHSEEPETSFRFNSVQYIRIAMGYKIKMIVHSHTSDDPSPSNADISACNAIKIPYFIVAVPSRETYLLAPGDLNV
jgi:proteasome lid subunit RPN8/RPN11